MTADGITPRQAMRREFQLEHTRPFQGKSRFIDGNVGIQTKRMCMYSGMTTFQLPKD